MTAIRKLLLASAVIGGLMSACVPQTPHPIGHKQHEPPDSSGKFYLEALARNRTVFRIDSARSLAVIEVRRSGSLARLGHDHIVASHDIQGYIAPDERRSDLYVQLDRLTVDEPE